MFPKSVSWSISGPKVRTTDQVPLTCREDCSQCLAKVFFAALRGPSRTKRCSPRPFPDKPNYDLAKVFFAALRGPSRTKRCFPRPFPDKPNYDLAKVFFAALRGPSRTKGVSPRPFPDKILWCVLRGPSRPFADKRCCPRPFPDNQTMTLQRCSSRPFAALRGQKGVSPRPFPDKPYYDLAKVFFAALRGPSRPFAERCSSRPFADKKCFPPSLPGQTKL